MMNARHANALRVCVSLLSPAHAGHVHHQNVQEFLGRCRAIFCVNVCDSRRTHVWARRQYLLNVRAKLDVNELQRLVDFHHNTPLAPIFLLSTVDCSSMAVIVTLQCVQQIFLSIVYIFIYIWRLVPKLVNLDVVVEPFVKMLVFCMKWTH